MSSVDGMTGKDSKGGLVPVASSTSVDTPFANGLILVAFDFPNSIAE
jgi:hypothetical protein